MYTYSVILNLFRKLFELAALKVESINIVCTHVYKRMLCINYNFKFIQHKSLQNQSDDLLNGNIMAFAKCKLEWTTLLIILLPQEHRGVAEKV